MSRRNSSQQKRNSRAISMGIMQNQSDLMINNNEDTQDPEFLQQMKFEKTKTKLKQRLIGTNNQQNMPSVQKIIDFNRLQPTRGLKARVAIENEQKQQEVQRKNQTILQQEQNLNDSKLPPIMQGKNTPGQSQQNFTNSFNTKQQQQRGKRSISMRPNQKKYNINNSMTMHQFDPLDKLNMSELPQSNKTQILPNNINDLSQIQQQSFNNLEKSRLDDNTLIQQQHKMLNFTHSGPKYIKPNNQQRLMGDPFRAKPVRALVDKMTGPIDIRYENMFKQQKLNKKMKELEGSELDESQIGESQQLSKSGLQENNNNSNVSDIDTFIQMVREHRLSPMEFIYLVKDKKHPNDAYNMNVIKYTTLVKEKIVDYYTLSSKGVTRYKNNEPIEFVHLGDWLKERHEFNNIKNLSFFKKFRKWKTLKKWVKILFKKRCQDIQKNLDKKLFFLNPIYQRTLSKHKELCYNFERLRFVDVSENNETMTLEKFSERQNKLRSEVVDQLQDYSKKLHENCQQGIKNMIDKMRQTILNKMSQEEEQMQMQQPGDNVEIGNNVDEKKQILEKLGFPTNMEYDLRKMMREEFQRFLRLAYLLDFICVQSLGNVYIGSAQEFLSRVKQIVECTIQTPVMLNPESFVQEYDPLVDIQFELCHKDPLDDYEIDKIEADCKELQEEKCSIFDLDTHAQLVTLPTDEEMEAEKQNQAAQAKAGIDDMEEDKYSLLADEDYPEDTMIEKRNVLNIHECWLELYPTQKSFFSEIQNIFSEGLDCIQVIERWSKNQTFLPYVKALEEWDEIIGEKWNKPESYYLNPSHWIKENQFANEFMQTVSKIMNEQFRRLERFKEEFQPLLNQFWIQINSDLSILPDRRLKRQSKIYQWILTCFQENLKTFEAKFVQSVHLGVFRVDCSQIQKNIVPEQKEIVENLEKLLLEIYQDRGNTEKQWLSDNINRLKGPAINIEEYVAKKESLEKTYREMPEKKDSLMILESLFHLLTEKQVQEVNSKQVQNLSHNLSKLENDLNAEINEVETSTAQNYDRFKKDLEGYISQLKEQSQDLMDKVRVDKFLSTDLPIDDAVKQLGELDVQMKEAEENMNKFNQYEEILGVQNQATYDTLIDARTELNLRHDMWKGIKEFEKLSKQWNQLPFSEIKAKEIATVTEKYYRTVQKCKKNLADNKVLPLLAEPVLAVRNTMPVVTALRSQYLTETHWDEIKSLLKADFDIHDLDFTLEKMIALKVGDFSEEIIEISVRAAQEDSIKTQLDEIEEEWDQVIITLKSYKDRQDQFVLAEVDELIQRFDEGLANMNGLLANRFVRPLRPRAQKIQTDLLLLQDIIDKWVECQKKWMHLENIFASPDIIKSLPEQAQSFQQCDKTLKQLMKKMESNPKIMRLVHKMHNLYDTLYKTSEALDEIEKKLEDFLETKRSAFPRFYFLSNDELLEILAKASQLNEVEPSLRKCFEGLVKLYMGNGNTTQNSILVQGMISPEGEVCQFFNNKIVKAQGNVETWLQLLQKEMCECIKKLIKVGFNDQSNSLKYSNRLEWIRDHIGQVVSVVSQVTWCMITEQTIKDNAETGEALSEHLETSIAQLNVLTHEVRQNLSSLQRKIIVALITQDVHNRDIISKLDEEEVDSLADFLWQQQLRYYMQEEDCKIKQVTTTLNYGNEYLGATSRLVITPLTDRCWITITSALANQLGANPAGPAGTGKTESTKDLAKGLGRLCIVFNCSDQITAAMMNKLFSGLCQQGAWTCLDEFNRIDIEVLSVIAQQLLIIRMALVNGVERFELEGKDIPLEYGYGVFITMNPGYAGRTELPDNLKALFRPVAMMIPDYSMIAEIMLFAEGFEMAPELSKKMVQLYKLSSEQLSQQDHYDFGMRALKSLLVMAGQLKRSDSKLSEDVVLIRAMRDANVPKFLREDLPLFSALVQDLFPSVVIPEVSYGELESEIQMTLRKDKYQKKSEYTTKIIQLFDTLNVRFGVMLVGPSGTGKTVCYQILCKVMCQLRKKYKELQKLNEGITEEELKHKINELYQTVEYHPLNPKSITMGELYGEVDPFTQEWVDGLASSVIRNVNTIGLDLDFDPQKKDWVVFDGPVDALWIENMNTVLDDNQTLCLANSERIKLRDTLRMLFEVQDLAVASPATVSRCGMVYLCHQDLGWSTYLKSWFEQHCNSESQEQAKELNMIYLPQEYQEHLTNMFDNTYENIVGKFTKFFEPFPTTKIQQVKNICNFMQIQLVKLQLEKNPDENKKKLNHIYAYSVIWGAASGIDSKFYDKLEITFKDIFQHLRFPRAETIFDFYVDDSQKCFLDWESKLEDFKYEKDSNYFELLVPTIDTTKYASVLEQLLDINKPVLFTGGTGVGKSVIIQNLLFKLKETKATNSVFLNFSAQTKSKETQLAIEGKLHKKGKTLFGARPNEKNVVFIDDINMPALEQYGAQPCIELLRLFIDKQGLFDRQKLFWKNVEDTTLVCAGAPPGGGRNILTPRFVRHFNVFCLPQPSESILVKIFGSIIKEFMGSANFNDGAKRMSEAAVTGTIDIYKNISEQLLPIPTKFHYTFNLRDISKVFQGILMIKPKECQSAEAFTKLWIHEVSRVFGDRLVNEEDNLWFQEQITNIVTRVFAMGWSQNDIFDTKIIYSDILKLDAGKVYEEVKEGKDRIKLQKTLEEKQDDYNFESDDKMDLVFFEQAQEHILRISRVLRQPRGSAMLIGVGGSGKQSLSKLASFIMKSEVFQIELVKNYGPEAFREDLIKMMKRTGVEMQPVSFIFTDVQIAHESFLEDINNLLNTGEVPNLFKKKEDYDEVINGIRPTAVKMKKPDSPESLWNFFIETVRQNLHIILCMSPVGSALRIRTRKFPSMVDCCTLDWFSAWPEEALYSVALKFLGEIDLPNVEMKENLAKLCMTVNVDVAQACQSFHDELKRKVYITPKSYLDHISLYSFLLDKKKKEILNLKSKLSGGLDKLKSTTKEVANLEQEMISLQPLLEEQGVKTEEALKKVNIDSQEANKKEALVSEEAAKVNEQADEIRDIADEAQQELNLALPALKEAEDALNTINKGDIAQIKGFVNPPQGVQMVLEAVCSLLGEKQDWSTAKQVMIDIGFIDRLKNYDRDNIPDKYLNKLRVYTSKPEFEPNLMEKQSKACKSLCMWCHAMDKYAKVARVVKPKQIKVADLNQKLQVKKDELQKKQDELNGVKEKVAVLQKNCDETMAKKKQLEDDIQKTKNRLIAAEKLTGLLAEEGVRWEKQIKEIDVTVNELIGNVFMSSSTMSYCGPFTIKYRDNLEKIWIDQLKEKKIPLSENYSIADTLETPINIRDWVLNGLPNDQFSMNNGVIAKQARRWPLMIDPQGEANKWLKKQEEENDLKICRFSDPHYLKTLQNSISSGFPVLIEDLTEFLDPAIDSVLQRQVIDQEGRKLIKVGDKKVDYDNRFQLYMTSKMANPHYLPEIFIKVTVINFSITFEGLQDQLLADVMKSERPDIEQQRDETIVTIANAKKTLKNAQDKILQLLADAQGMILDDVELISTLEESKFKSAEIVKKLEETEVIEKEINDNRNLYLPIAVRGTVIYFVVSDLSGIDPMYQFSLQYFKKLYRQAMASTEENSILTERLALLNENITKVIFTDICRGLFESHKKLFAFLITTSIQRQAGDILPAAWNLLIRGPGLEQEDQKNKKLPNPDPKEVSDDTWHYINTMGQQLEALNKLPKSIQQNLQKWIVWKDSADVYNEPLPTKFEETKDFSNFYKLIMIRALRPEKIMQAFSQYVSEVMGTFYDTIPSTTMEQIYNDSDCNTPIIFILSQGADPTQMLIKLSKDKDKDITQNVISLGQGQGEKAQKLLDRAKKDGSWVLLQNCHLCKSWMPDLEKNVEEFPKPGVIPNEEFRLFLTSMPVDYFPVSVLQNGIKLTTEAPRGLKANLIRSIQEINQEYLDDIGPKKDSWVKLLFGLTFFHATIQERRKFGSLGFNIRYEFNDSDIDISKSTLKMFLNTKEEEQIPYDAMMYMTGQINYGGRVTDDWDRRCLLSILKQFYNPAALEKGYTYSESGVYHAPETSKIEEFRSYIDQLPNFDQPEIFGMHENANITFQQQESNKLIETILSIQPRDTQGGSGGEVKSNDDIVIEIAQNLAEQLPEVLDRETAFEELFELTEVGAYQSLTTVLLQEMEKFNRLLKTCATSLQQLQKAIKGFVVMSQDLDDMYLAFLNNQLPPIWKKVSYATLKPLSSWYKDLLERIIMMRDWLQKGNPSSYWLSGFYFPQGFLTGVLQTHSRKYKLPIDTLSFKFQILHYDSDAKTAVPAQNGVYIHGLFCDGGKWNDKTQSLEDQQIGQLYSNMPPIHFIPEEKYTIPEENYICPVYKTSNRVGVLSTTGQSTNFILGIGIPIKTRPEFWTLRGTALLCQLDN